MAEDQMQKVEQASDVRKIEKLIQGIVGETCWGVRISYGDELRLEIGARLPHPILKGKEKGAWTLGVRASEWFLYLADNAFVTSNDDLTLIQQRILFMEGNRITALKVGYPALDLDVLFGDQMRFKIVPGWDDSSKLAHWELFMPNSMLLQVGPQATWSYHRSDIPMSKLKPEK